MSKDNSKTCKICNVEKIFAEFTPEKRSKDGYRYVCKQCRALKARENRASNPNAMKTANKRYYNSHKVEILEQKKEYFEKKKDSIRSYRKKRYEKNKVAICQSISAYQKLNRDKINANKSRREKIRRLEDPKFMLTKRLRARLGVALRRSRNKKSLSTFSLLGCSIEDFKIYLQGKFQPGMSWETYGINGWHIDHIVPCCSFDLSKEEDQKRCFHYTNMQPLWSKDNLAKGPKIGVTHEQGR